MVASIRIIILAAFVLVCSYMRSNNFPNGYINTDSTYSCEKTEITNGDSTVTEKPATSKNENSIPHTISFVENASTSYEACVYDSESNLLQRIQIESIVFPKSESVDINMDGYLDIVVCTGGTLNENHLVFVWDNEVSKYISVVFIGFDLLSYYEISQGYITNWAKDDIDTVIVQKLVWEGNSLRLESQEIYDLSED